MIPAQTTKDLSQIQREIWEVFHHFSGFSGKKL